MRLTLRLTTLTVLACAFASGSCGSIPVGSQDAQPQEIRPWMPYFVEPQFLVADEVRIEGPNNLLEHVALGHDPLAHIYSTETTPDGLLQIVEVRPGITDAPEIRAQVDSLDVRALRRIVVLERVGQPPLEISARGQAWWALSNGQDELRRPQLVLPRDLPLRANARPASAPVGER